jgi:MFS family permease
MNALEWRATGTLSLIQALRMLGMFMILPVFALYASHLPTPAAPWQIGLAIGLYGIVQAILQIPFGILSDRIGRKPVIVFGLLMFAAGAFIAGATKNIHWIMIGRAVQGAGAISGAASAFLADSTRQEVRTVAMAVYGIGMGLSFIIALILGPVFDGWIGVNGIFTMTGVLALLAIPLLLLGTPHVPRAAESEAHGFAKVLADRQLLRLDGGIFMLHAMMTCLFLAAPFAIEKTFDLPAPEHWHIYLPILLGSVLVVFPMIRRVEAAGRVKPAFLGSVGLLGLALAFAAEGYEHSTELIIALVLFFSGFNYLEGTLPSLISKRAPVSAKGAALGIYSSSQFLGGAFGSTLGGFMLGHWGVGATFLSAAVLAALWLGFGAGIEIPTQADAGSHELHPAGGK